MKNLMNQVPIRKDTYLKQAFLSTYQVTSNLLKNTQMIKQSKFGDHYKHTTSRRHHTV